MPFCKIVVCPEDSSILAKTSFNFKLEIQESVSIILLKPTLNKTSPQYRYTCLYSRKDSVIMHG